MREPGHLQQLRGVCQLWVAGGPFREEVTPQSMSDLSKNQLFSRRGFVRRAVKQAAAASAGMGILGLKSRAATDKPNPWAYDDSAFRRTDPKLIRYQEQSRFQLSHAFTRCLCLTQDEHVLIGAGKYVTEYTDHGNRVSEFQTEDDVRCLCDDLEKSLYIGFRTHVEIYDRKGRKNAAWKSPGAKTYLTSLTTNGVDIFAADAGNRVVWRYDSKGNLKGKIDAKHKDNSSSGFIVPSPFFDVQMAPDGLLRVTNTGRHQVELYTVEGELERAWGKPGAAIENFCGCCNPIATAPLPDGRTVTFEKGIPRVKIYNKTGVFESVVAGAELFPENAKVCGPNDCTLGGLHGAVDKKGRIFILDFAAANVRIMEEKKEM
jgi:hypothetical protein